MARRSPCIESAFSTAAKAKGDSPADITWFRLDPQSGLAPIADGATGVPLPRLAEGSNRPCNLPNAGHQLKTLIEVGLGFSVGR